MANPNVSAPPDPTGQAPDTAITTETIGADAAALADEVQGLASTVAGEAADQATEIANQAKARVLEQTDKIKGFAGKQKDLLAEQIGGVASAMDRVADEFESEQKPGADYVRLIARNADNVSSAIRQNDVDTLLNEAQNYGRRQPIAFAAIAAALGFAASRLLLASAHRNVAPTPTQYPDETMARATPVATSSQSGVGMGGPDGAR